MELEFKVYEGAATLTNLGTVKEIGGENGQLMVLKDTAADRASIIVKRADGTSARFTCSANLTKIVRDRKITLSELASLNVLAGESGIPFVTMPAGAGTGWIKFADLKDVAYTPESVSQYEALAL